MPKNAFLGSSVQEALGTSQCYINVAVHYMYKSLKGLQCYLYHCEYCCA